MRVLNSLLGVVLVVSLLVPAVAVTTAPAAAHPPSEPDHGIEPAMFWALWSGDDDAYVNGSVYRKRTGMNRTGMQALANGTDIPLTAPPKAVERWNRRDLEEFPPTDRTKSIHPQFATLADRRFIKDAYAAIFAVQPSTHAHLSVGETPLLVRDTGSVLGTVDYRVAVPSNDTIGAVRTWWYVREHNVRSATLVVDGQQVASGPGSHKPTLSFDNLPGSGLRSIELQAKVGVRLQRRTDRCTNMTTDGCMNWTTSWRTFREEIVVTDERLVREHDPDVSGSVAVFPDGDVGVAVSADGPWRGLTSQRGAIRTQWRFYSARDERWDTLSTTTESGSSQRHSPVHPLAVHAYPGPTPIRTDFPRGQVLESRRTMRLPPDLPSDINLDSAAGSYGITNRLVARIGGIDDPSSVRYRGLVRGSGGQLLDEVSVTHVRPTNLNVTVLNVSRDTVTVAVELTDVSTGRVIATVSRPGHVVVNGQQFETRSGTAIRTVERGRGGIYAEFRPGPWWRSEPAYASASDVAFAGGGLPDLARVLFVLLRTGSVLLVAVFLLDRIVPGDAWPPWRRR